MTKTSFSAASHLVLILYTTKYREGGKQFELVAKAMAARQLVENPKATVICRAVESKKEFVDVFTGLNETGDKVDEFHFIGHSGVYGIMFGTTKWPEQFSPFEWKSLKLPFHAESRAYFHACRTARWFAPFFARTFEVKTYGYHWYTTISRKAHKFSWEALGTNDDLHVISCAGKKSHGVFASVTKHLGFAKSFPMTEFCPSRDRIDATYDSVAELYADTFEDIGVREDELRWLINQLGDASDFRVLDIGCGNGAFLSKLAPGLKEAVGVDISEKMLEQARERNKANPHLSFQQIHGPQLPFPDNSFDRVISVLSFRYLDWDPIVKEILRVLKPGGEFLVVDMVAAPVKGIEFPLFLRSKLKVYWQRISHRRYFQALKKMVTDRRWQNMLKHNPIRSEHEMRWYLESRFKERKTELLNVGWSSRVLAFRSGPISEKSIPEMTYP
ncbi:MAG: class I SAM-dependent methyltransferase [Bdellovibrionota bacterium]